MIGITKNWKKSKSPLTGTTMKKYKKQMDWRRNKVRDVIKGIFPI